MGKEDIGIWSAEAVEEPSWRSLPNRPCWTTTGRTPPWQTMTRLRFRGT